MILALTMVTLQEVLADSPALSLTARVTVYVPTFLKAWVGVAPDPTDPSPKFQA